MKEKKKTITEEDIQKALRKFIRKGGLIERLPDEIVPRNMLVGAKFGTYETVMETATLGNSES